MRYQYSSEGFKNDFHSRKNQFNLTGVNFIIILNLLIFLFVGNNGNIINALFGINSNNFKIWQIFTYMFLHAGLMHLFFNMFLLWMFGKQIESVWGTKKFVQYYLICGIGAGFLIYVFSDSVTIGASGAVMAILFAYAYLYPNQTLLFYLIPMKAKYCIFILILTELSQEIIRNPNDNVSHIGHLGGMLIGYIYLKYGRKLLSKIFFIKVKKIDRDKTNKISDVDLILDKLKLKGWEGLDENEKSILYKASKDKQKYDSIN